MDKLEFEDILAGLSEGKFEPSYIIKLLDDNQLNHLDSDEIEEIALSFDRDEDKISTLKHVYAPIKIIKTLKTEDSVVKAIGELTNDEQKARVASRFLKDDKNKLMAIEEIKDNAKALPVKILLSREGFKKNFLREENRKYHKIGLDKDMTIGVEIETLGKNSEKILEAGEKNGTIIHKEKEIECGKILKRRK